MKPLSKIRVLDLSRVLAGPLVGQMLADLGAEVIKIERPGSGDDARGYGPPFLKDQSGRELPDTSTFFLSVNRNKKSVTLDIATRQGQALARQLAAKCDVVLENYKVGTLARYGLDYESLKVVNPGVVYLSVTGYGQTGPYKDRPGYDAVFQGMGGLMSVNGEPDDVPGGGPMKVGPSIADVITGLYSSSAVLSALYHRDANGGSGQSIDMALLDCVIASLSHYSQQYLSTGEPPPRRGTHGNGGVPSQMFRCADGAIMLTCGNNEQYKRLCEVLGRSDLGTDERFATNAVRVVNRKIISPILEDLMRAWQMEALLDALNKAGVPAGPIYNLKQVFADPQVVHRGMAVSSTHPNAGDIKLVASPIRLSETPVDRYEAPPTVGQHTHDVLRELLDLAPEEIERLSKDRVI